MNFNPFALLLTLVSGLLLAALTAWIRRPRLALFVPRLFSHSALIGGAGQLAELSIMNRGFKTEEAVEVSLAPTFKYDIVGSTNEDISLIEKKLIIPRIGAGDEVTVIILVEGGIFSASQISNCLSKETKGIIIERLEQVPMTGPQRVGAVATFVVLPMLVFLFYFGVSDYFGKKIEQVENIATKTATEKATKQATKNAIAAAVESNVVNDWIVPNFYINIGGPLAKEFQREKIILDIESSTGKSDVVNNNITIKNKSDYVLKISLEANTQRSEGRIPSYDRHLSGVLVTPGATVSKNIKVIVPSITKNPEDKKIYFEAFIQEAGGDSLKIMRTVVMN